MRDCFDIYFEEYVDYFRHGSLFLLHFKHLRDYHYFHTHDISLTAG